MIWFSAIVSILVLMNFFILFFLNEQNQLLRYGYQTKTNSDVIYFVFRYRFLIVCFVTDNLLNCDVPQLGTGQCKNIYGSMVQVFVPFFFFFPP